MAGASSFIVQVIHSWFGYSDPVPSDTTDTTDERLYQNGAKIPGMSQICITFPSDRSVNFVVVSSVNMGWVGLTFGFESLGGLER